MKKTTLAAVVAVPIVAAGATFGGLTATGVLEGDAPIVEDLASGAEAAEAIAGDVLFEFTIELTVSAYQPPPLVTDLKLYKPDGMAYVDFNSRFVWTEIPQFTEHIEPFLIANEGETDVIVDIAILDAPTWAIFTVDPATVAIIAGSSADVTWTMTITGDAPVGATAVVILRGVQQ